MTYKVNPNKDKCLHSLPLYKVRIMLYSAIKAATNKQPIYTALAAVLLLTTASSALAVNSDTQAVTLQASNYCHDDLQTQTSAYKYQSTQQRAMSCMLTQLQAYQQKDRTARQQYFAYKAQAWLNYAIHQDSINSRSPAGTYAMQSAETILQALKNDTTQGLDLYQDIPSNSALMRPDLWATLTALKDSDGIGSAPREIAFSEVALIWAATNQCERGSRESGSHFRMADRWLEQAREAYVNAHDSKTNVALENLIVRYYKQYAPLDSSEDVCKGQELSSIAQ